MAEHAASQGTSLRGVPLGVFGPLELAALRERYVAAQLAGSRREVLRLVVEEGLERGATVGQLQAHVIRAAQAEIGRLWQHNRISIAQEHLATALSQLAMAHLFQCAEP